MNYLSPVTIFLCLFSFVVQETQAQDRSPIMKADTLLKEIDTLLKHDDPYVTNRIFDTIVYARQKLISGFQMKDGKMATTSVTLQDKSITVNTALRLSNTLVLQPSLTGTSNKDFVSIFVGNKYQRTLSGGLTLQFYHQSGNFDKSDKYYLHNAMRNEKEIWKKQYANQKPVDNPNALFVKSFKASSKLYQAMEDGKVIFSGDTAIAINAKTGDTTHFGKEIVESLNLMLGLVPGLIKSGVLDDSWINLFARKGEKIVDKIDTTTAKDSVELLSRLTKMQLEAPWTSFKTYWFTAGIQFNHATNGIYDEHAGIENLFRRDVTDKYISIQGSYNFLKSKLKNRNRWVSVNVAYSKQRKYDNKDQLTLQTEEQKSVNGKPYTEIIKTATMYKADVDKKDYLTLEVPYTLYWVKSKFGIDLAAAMDVSSVINDVSARIGIYIPVSAGDKMITVEPLLRLSGLNQKGKSFFKEQTAFGFSLSVSIPKFMLN